MKKINQTGLLFAAVLLLIIMFFSKLILNYYPFLVLLIVCLAVSLVSMFLIHHRMLQIRFCIYNIIVLIAFQGWLAYSFFTRPDGVSYPLTAVFPIICAILTFLALRYIAADEATARIAKSVRSIKKNRRRN